MWPFKKTKKTCQENLSLCLARETTWKKKSNEAF